MDSQKTTKPILHFRDWELNLIRSKDKIIFQFRATNNIHDHNAGTMIYDSFLLELYRNMIGALCTKRVAAIAGEKGTLEMQLDTDGNPTLFFHRQADVVKIGKVLMGIVDFMGESGSRRRIASSHQRNLHNMSRRKMKEKNLCLNCQHELEYLGIVKNFWRAVITLHGCPRCDALFEKTVFSPECPLSKDLSCPPCPFESCAPPSCPKRPEVTWKKRGEKYLDWKAQAAGS